MARTRSLTVYQLRRTVDGVPLVDFDQAIEPEALPATVSYDLETGPGFAARLYVLAPEAAEPAWVQFLREGFGGNVVATATANNRAVIVLRVRYMNADRWFALTFGAGRWLLRRGACEQSHGMRTALNVIFEGDSRQAPTAPARVRRVDAKTVAQNTLRASLQTDRFATFEAFGLDVQRDLLSAVVGQPADTAVWGSRIAGADAVHLTVPVDFADLGELCKRLYRKGRADDYKARFDWVDNIRVTTDPIVVTDLDRLLVEQLRASAPAAVALAPPELVEWDEIESFGFSLDPTDLRPELELGHYLGLLDAGNGRDALTIDSLKKDRAFALDAAGETIYQWPVFRTLSGELERAGITYLLEGGDYFEIEPGYMETLDGSIGRLVESRLDLPLCALDTKGNLIAEGDYNVAAAGFSDQYLLLDKETVKIDSHTSPIEICDILTTGGQFVHVKCKLDSSSLSHLFSQGYVSADLFLMSPQFREGTRARIESAEEKRGGAFAGRFSQWSQLDNPDPRALEVVYGIIAKWGGRSLGEALPFFAKVNLRRHAHDLRRMGYRVSFKRIDVAGA